jgi:glycosyltransferase involved in cell wall biosynthesis
VRVLLITDWMSGAGGAEWYMTWVRDGLRAAGDEVKLLTSSAGSAGDGSADYRAYATDRLAGRALLQIVNPFALISLRTALRRFRPDVVLVNMFEHHLSPAILPQLRGVPSVLTVTDYKCICPVGSKLLPDDTLCTEHAGLVCRRSGCVSLPHWLRDQPRYALIAAGLKCFDRVLACSQWVQQELEKNWISSEHLPLPVPLPRPGFHRAPASDPLFVYCGRLDREKGVLLLLRAFARLRTVAPTSHLRIVGRGPQLPMLEQLVDALGLREAVTFRGWVPPEDVELELVDAWALVAPSLWAEPLGLVALEAIVRGVPVIASGSGGFGETVEHGVSGLLFPNGDEDGLVQQLRAVACRQTFPTQTLPDVLVQRVRQSHRVQHYVSRLRQIFSEIATADRS